MHVQPKVLGLPTMKLYFRSERNVVHHQNSEILLQSPSRSQRLGNGCPQRLA